MESKNKIILEGGTIAKGDNVGVRWEKDAWVFDVVGNNAIQYANELESAFGAIPFENINKGQIQVVIGNRVTTHIAWQQNNYLFSLEYKGNVEDAIKMVNEAANWIDLNYAGD